MRVYIYFLCAFVVKGFSDAPVFLKKKNFVSNEFLKQNNEKFGYKRFDFLYLADSDNIENNISKLNEKINNFFKD